MNSFFKKSIISILALAIFLAPVSFKLKNQTVLAQEEQKILTISSAVTNAKPNNIILIKATLKASVRVLVENKNGFVITFNSSPSEDNFSSPNSPTSPPEKNKCYISSAPLNENLTDGTCTIYFNSLKTGNYKITASVPYKNTVSNSIDLVINSDASGIPTIETQDSKLEPTSNYDLGCSLNPFKPNLTGCIAGLTYGIWTISASVAELAGRFLDFFIFYSTDSASYKNDFVEQAWAAVRDIANIFFIIALIYVAIKTILGLNVTDNKRLIGAIIVIALFINFSLFTTKIIIDGTNILAKIFYTNINTEDATGNSVSGAEGEKSISIGLIRSFNPQEIVMHEYYIQSPWSFIFITILAILLTLGTAYIFFSVALLFVSRVISLWLSMIFSPIAFASYTVPFPMPGFGHKEWWSDLFKNALLAPLFIFFLYLIVMFLKILPAIAKYKDGTDMQHLMSTIIPFIILFVLLKKSKELAQQYAGEMGKAIVGIGATVGGLAIGGTAMTAAAIGRGTVGAFMKAASTGDTTNQRFKAGTSINTWDKIKGATLHYGTLGMLTGAQKYAGKAINWDQHKVEHAAHARHDLDQEADKVAHGKKWNELNGDQRATVRTNMARADAMRNLGYGNKTWNQINNAQRAAVNALLATPGNLHHAFVDTKIKDAKRKQGIISNVVQSGVTGSYDIRGLANIVAKEQTSALAKLTSGITGVVASGIRGGLKGALNINYGQSQRTFLKDLGHTITEALKGMDVKVDLSHVGEEKKEDHHGGGHGHH